MPGDRLIPINNWRTCYIELIQTFTQGGLRIAHDVQCPGEVKSWTLVLLHPLTISRHRHDLDIHLDHENSQVQLQPKSTRLGEYFLSVLIFQPSSGHVGSCFAMRSSKEQAGKVGLGSCAGVEVSWRPWGVFGALRLRRGCEKVVSAERVKIVAW